MDSTERFSQSIYEYEDEEIFEPLPYSDEVKALVNAIKGAVKADIQAKIASLTKEVEELSSVKKNWKKLIQEQRSLQSSVEIEKRNAVNKARQERLGDLFGNRTLTLWRTTSESRKKEKCSLCDDSRQLHATLPNGKIISQACDCSGFYYFYTPKQLVISEIRLDRWQEKLSVWYRPYKDKTEDGYSSSDFVANSQVLGEVKSFGDLPKDESFYFDTEEHAQKYCDWLNAGRK